ncbi:MAG: Purine-binding protein [Alphaproteobacteria bacterium MarineAlpha3_Bin5]|nr:BMP family ABC transporter substrate-binding protein [Magnetovibrio sp.]PPR74638.1 MAG: Purine-binding protein [Alphaproteobacteria bacterium MarineAlpha3_Bin5]
MKSIIRNFWSLLTIISTIALIGSANAADPLKVGFVYVGPIGDHGWTYEHDRSRLAIEKAFGSKVKTTYLEKIPEGPDAERAIQQLARTDHDIIFTTSFGFMNPTIKVAKKFPKIKFEHATGFKRAENVSTYSARFYEGRHIIGLIAGKMTKTNTIGYIASFPIPEVVRGINAAYLAAKSVNPAIKFKIVWVNTWFDPGKEADAANALIAQGADILMQHTDSPAAMQVAEKKGIFAFGQASNMKAFGPNAQLTSIINNWAPYCISRVKAVMDGAWKSQDTWDGIGPSMVAISKFSEQIPADVRSMAGKARDAIAAGTLHPFTGPINKQDGSPWLKAEEIAPDGDLAGMNFYVEGVEGALPK